MIEITYNSEFKSAKQLISKMARVLDEDRLCGVLSGVNFEWLVN
jgi:hypothetical protein